MTMAYQNRSRETHGTATAPHRSRAAATTPERNRPSQHLLAIALPSLETSRLAATLDAQIEMYGFDAATDGSDIIQMARDVARRLPGIAPHLVRALRSLRHEIADALYITNLPQGESRVALLSLAMTWKVGNPFNFASQNGGALLMRIEPANGSAANTNSTPEPFGFHSDDAALLRQFRVDVIGLFGRVAERTDIMTWFAAARDIERAMGGFDPIYFDSRFSVRMPLSFGMGDNIWSSAVPLLTRTNAGTIEIALPTYATRPVDPNDIEAANALKKLGGHIEAVARAFPVLPGTALMFANNRGLHARDRIGDARRALYRTYSRSNIDDLRSVTGIDGRRST